MLGFIFQHHGELIWLMGSGNPSSPNKNYWFVLRRVAGWAAGG